MSLQEQRPQVKEIAAVRSAQAPSAAGASRITMGGPPPSHLSGAGPSGTVGTQLPMHPSSGPQAAPHAPQCALSVAVSTHARSHIVRPGGHESTHPPETHA